jgi:hypothetical protein
MPQKVGRLKLYPPVTARHRSVYVMPGKESPMGFYPFQQELGRAS